MTSNEFLRVRCSVEGIKFGRPKSTKMSDYLVFLPHPMD